MGDRSFFVDVIGGCGLVCKLFMNYLLNNCFYFCRQVKFRRGSIDLGWQKNIARAARKKKKYAPALKKILRRNIMIPRVFFNLVSGSRHREALGFAPLQIIFPSFGRH